tara:strand:+ start:55 stop:360 length:306 start_codon:yes stop_codon:yes gene_type:complete
MKTNIDFARLFKEANILSLLLFLLSIFIIFFKGLNYGIDFKGGTLIELRVDNESISINEIRSAFNNKNFGDINIKEFGEKGDYLIKVEQSSKNNNQYKTNY